MRVGRKKNWKERKTGKKLKEGLVTGQDRKFINVDQAWKSYIGRKMVGWIFVCRGNMGCCVPAGRPQRKTHGGQRTLKSSQDLAASVVPRVRVGKEVKL